MKNLNFIRTMKSAGTTIHSILQPHINNGKAKVFVLLNDDVYKMGAQTNSWADAPWLYYNRLETDLMSQGGFGDGSWTFGFVRNPWDRMVSAWKWSTNDMSFGEFVSLTDVRDMDLNKLIVRPLHIKQIKQTQFSLLTDKNNDISYIDRICRFENISGEIKLIREKLGANVEAPVPHLRRTEHKYYKEYYNDDLINAVAEQYKIDIDTFNYEY